MGNHGKLEALITIPTGGWTSTLTESAGGTGTPVFTAANTYYHSTAGNDSIDFPAELKAQLDAESPNGRTYTVTLGGGEDGTGKLTISVDSGTFTLTGVTAAYLALMGFTGELTPTASSFTSQSAVQGLWLPPSASNSLYGASDAGWDEADYVATKAPDGTVVATRYNRFVANRIEWQNCQRAKVRTAYESTTNESFQTFWIDGVLGEQAWATVGGPILWYPDADVDGTSFNYAVINPGKTFRPERVVQNWTGLYPVVLDRLIKVPT